MRNLAAHIDSTESGLDEVKSEVQELKSELVAFQQKVRSVCNGSVPDQYQNSVMLESISMLEKKNAQLPSNSEKVSSSKWHSSSTDLVIDSLTAPAEVNLTIVRLSLLDFS